MSDATHPSRGRYQEEMSPTMLYHEFAPSFSVTADHHARYLMTVGEAFRWTHHVDETIETIMTFLNDHTVSSKIPRLEATGLLHLLQRSEITTWPHLFSCTTP